MSTEAEVPVPRSRARIAVTAALLVAILAAALIWGRADSAFNATTSNTLNAVAAGDVVLNDDAAAQRIILNSGNLAPGEVQQQCIRLDYDGSLPSGIVAFATAGGGALAPYLNVQITEGTGGGFNNCAAFAPETIAYTGTLANLATRTTYATGVGSFLAPGPGVDRTYKVRWELAPTTPNAVMTTTANIDLTWEARSTYNQQLQVTGRGSYGVLGTGDTSNLLSFTAQGVDPGTNGWAQVDINGYHSCGIRGVGELWCWGTGTENQLGTGTATNQLRPVRIGADTDWLTVSAGDGSTCALKIDRSLWCWGDNDHRRVGASPPAADVTPARVGTDTWRVISAGSGHLCGVRSDGTLWCGGKGVNGALGLGTTINQPSLTQVGTDTTWTTVSTSGTDEASCGLKSDESLWCWGRNVAGSTGTNTTAFAQLSPLQVGATRWGDVTMGDDHGCGIQVDGSLWCWGNNNRGQLGLTAPYLHKPERVGTDTDWSDVSNADRFGCATKTDRTYWCTGRNPEGQLGRGPGADSNVFTVVPGLKVARTHGGGYRDASIVIPWPL